MKKPVTLILDTDIGSDIDDTWALAMILKSPELDLKLVTTEEDDTVYKAKLCAKILEAAGRSDVPVGIGIKSSEDNRNQLEWVKDYDLNSYPNVCKDGVQALIDTVMNSDEIITILAIGPVKNLAAAVEREPAITKKSRIVGVHGNIYNGFCNESWHPPLGSEWNIRCDLKAYRRAFEQSDWDIEMIPLDLTGSTHLPANLFEKVRSMRDKDSLINALMENQDIWFKYENYEFKGESSCLFDTVGVYAAFTHENITFERLPLYANDASITLVDPERGKYMNVGVKWGDKQKFYKFLCARLCSEI